MLRKHVNLYLKAKDEWKDWAEYGKLSGTEGAKKSAEKYGVSIKKR